MAIRSYSPTDVDILLAGFYKLDGFVEGTFITVTKDVQPYKTRRTADGSMARTFIKDNSYTIEITLASTSPSNDILTKLYQVDSISQYAKFPLFVKDRLGTSLFLAPTVWVKELPEMSYSDEVEPRVWRLQASQASFSVGGNEDVSGPLQDLINAGVGLIEGF